MPRFEGERSRLRLRKSILILLIAVLLITLLTGCARNPGATATPAASQPDPYQPIP